MMNKMTFNVATIYLLLLAIKKWLHWYGSYLEGVYNAASYLCLDVLILPTLPSYLPVFSMIATIGNENN